MVLATFVADLCRTQTATAEIPTIALRMASIRVALPRRLAGA
jgi:hypothetical protein